MKFPIFINLILFLQCFSSVHAQRFISDVDLWKHVVTIDRLAWDAREGVKKINKTVEDESYVRRVYLDITGRIPTYDQMLSFRKSKSVNKRSELVQTLLASPGYASHYTVFWQDLLRSSERTYTRYIERFLLENKKYDAIVRDLIMAKGGEEQNPAMYYYNRDSRTGPSDTFNATTRAFLGTRLGCAQCHNHRFDKWTQKEFYESSAFLQGVLYQKVLQNQGEKIINKHMEAMTNDKNYNDLSSSFKKLINVSYERVLFRKKTAYTFNYPDNYVYDNAKPGSPVKARIVFDYGNHKLVGETEREQFANWLASKENPMFARVMTNRLWKRIIGFANMDPIDDYKDSNTIQNKALFEILGDIFIEVDYDFKAFLSILFNTEAYLYAYDAKNEFDQDQYKVQGALMKRMSSSQLRDSLSTLQHGNLDRFMKTDPQYFEFEDKLREITHSYKREIIPAAKAYKKKNGIKIDYIDQSIVDILMKHYDKVSELEEYYGIQKNGRLENDSTRERIIAAETQESEKPTMLMNNKGSSMQGKGKGSSVSLAYRSNSEFLGLFGRSDFSFTNTGLNNTATMKQILKLTNSTEALSVTKSNSYLMKNAMAKKEVPQRVSYLYYSIFGRAPNKAEVNVAIQYCKTAENEKRWSKYVLALINSPEFYFIK